MSDNLRVSQFGVVSGETINPFVYNTKTIEKFNNGKFGKSNKTSKQNYMLLFFIFMIFLLNIMLLIIYLL